MSHPLVSSADLPGGSEAVASWIRLERLARHVVGRRLTLGASPETDEALDKLMILRAWTARRPVN